MRQGQGSAVFRPSDRVTFKQNLEFLGGVEQFFRQHPTAYLGVCKRSYGAQCFGKKLCTEFFAEILLKTHILQHVRFVPTRERAVAFARYKPQTQRLFRFLDRADDYQIGFPIIQNLAGTSAHLRPPFVRGVGRRNNSGGADQLDASDA